MVITRKRMRQAQDVPSSDLTGPGSKRRFIDDAVRHQVTESPSRPPIHEPHVGPFDEFKNAVFTGVGNGVPMAVVAATTETTSTGFCGLGAGQRPREALDPSLWDNISRQGVEERSPERLDTSRQWHSDTTHIPSSCWPFPGGNGPYMGSVQAEQHLGDGGLSSKLCRFSRPGPWVDFAKFLAHEIEQGRPYVLDPAITPPTDQTTPPEDVLESTPALFTEADISFACEMYDYRQGWRRNRYGAIADETKPGFTPEEVREKHRTESERWNAEWWAYSSGSELESE